MSFKQRYKEKRIILVNDMVLDARAHCEKIILDRFKKSGFDVKDNQSLHLFFSRVVNSLFTQVALPQFNWLHEQEQMPIIKDEHVQALPEDKTV